MNERMQIKPIRNRKEHKAALNELYQILDAPKGSEDFDRAELLSILIEKYEEEHFPVEAPDPIEAIKYLMKEHGMNQTQLGEIVGGKSKASLILNKKRALSISMIRNLNKKLKIPLQVLIKEYPIAI